MTTIPRKQYRKQSSTDPVPFLTYALAIGILLFYGAQPGAFEPTFDRTLGIQKNANAISLSSGASFASDAQYWDANCSHGWTSDAACDAISARAQFCAVGIASGYCTEYDTYLQRVK